MQVGKLEYYNLEKNFSNFYYEIDGRRWDYVTRVLHNQEQIMRCQLRDGTDNPQAYIKYFNMDGTAAAQFTIGSGGVPYTQVLDLGWMADEEKMVYAIMAAGVYGSSSIGYSVIKCLPDGASPELLIKDINTTYTTTWATSSVSGYVGITASDSDIFLKVGPEFHQINRESLAGGNKTWSDLVASGYVFSSSNAFHYGSGLGCVNLTFQPSTEDYVLYSWYDSTISTLYLRSISVSGTVATYSGGELMVSGSVPEYKPYRWAMLNIPDYGNIQYPIFINQLDSDSLHILSVTTISGYTVTSTPAYLNVFNIDTSLAAFLNVNSSDSVMPAGIGATSEIQAKVTNCWGTTLSGKLVQFWVSSGDGGVNPSYAYTDINGKATTTFTTGANVGISNIAVVVNEI